MSFVNNKKEISMKKILFFAVMLVMGISYASAQSAQIKFDKTTHDFGTFSENSPVVTCVFTFTNIGDAPLVILRMYGARLYKRTDSSRKDRYY